MRMDRLDVNTVLAPYLFPNAPKRLSEYLVAREQYDLTSAMARNQVSAFMYIYTYTLASHATLYIC